MADLSEMGEALYGGRWHEPLALALEVNLRTVQRWASGRQIPPATVLEEVRELLRQRRQQIEGMLR